MSLPNLPTPPASSVPQSADRGVAADRAVAGDRAVAADQAVAGDRAVSPAPPRTAPTAKDLTQDHYPIEIYLGSAVQAAVANHLPKDLAPAKRDQLRRNGLAIAAVERYCQMLDLPTQRQGCTSQDPLKRLLEDAADLEIPGRGRIECRPIAPEANELEIPPESWGDRAAWVAVQLDPEERRASLLGFVTEVGELSHISLTALRPLDEFAFWASAPALAPRNSPAIDAEINPAIHPQITPDPHPKTTHPPSKTWLATLGQQINNLNHWLDGIIDTGWEVIAPEDPQPVFRSSSHPLTPLAHRDVKAARRPITLALAQGNYQVELSTEIKPGPGPERAIAVRLRAIEPASPGGAMVLPDQLHLEICDEDGLAVMQVVGGGSPSVVCRFGVPRGEKFAVRTRWGETEIIECFVA